MSLSIVRTVTVLASLVLLSGCALLGRQAGSYSMDDGTDEYTVDCGTVEDDFCGRLVKQNLADFRRDEPGVPIDWVVLLERPSGITVRVCGRAPSPSPSGAPRCRSWDWESGPA